MECSSCLLGGAGGVPQTCPLVGSLIPLMERTEPPRFTTGLWAVSQQAHRQPSSFFAENGAALLGSPALSSPCLRGQRPQLCTNDLYMNSKRTALFPPLLPQI